MAGSLGTVLQYVILVALVRFASVSAVAASTVGAIAGAIVNYGVNHRWTFASERSHGHALPRFAGVALAGVIVNGIVMNTMLRFVGAHYLAAQVVATGAVFMLSYVVNRSWTF
jgi:putative flippase GtrA